MDDLFSAQNLPIWVIIFFFVIRNFVEVIKNKDFLWFLNSRKEPNEKMKASIEMLVETLKGLQNLIIELERYIKVEMDERLRKYQNFSAEVFLNKFQLEMYIAIVKYLNKIKWEYGNLLEVKKIIQEVASEEYKKNKTFLNFCKVNVNEFNNWNIDEKINKIIDILNMNGGSSIEMKKEFIMEILLN